MDTLQHLFAPPTGFALEVVKDNADRQSRGRIQVTPLGNDMDVWAPCVVPSAGGASGTTYGGGHVAAEGRDRTGGVPHARSALRPRRGMDGQNAFPTEATPVDDCYAIKTTNGTTFVIDGSAPSVAITTPHNNSITLTDSGDTCTVQVGGSTIQATTSGVTVTTSASIQLQTASLTVSAPSVTVNAATAQFSGVVQCDTMIANTVVGASYTPGAGNVW